MSDTLVSLFNAFFSAGMIIGPLISSYLTLATNFRTCSDFEAILIFSFLIVYFLAVYLPMKLDNKKRRKAIN